MKEFILGRNLTLVNIAIRSSDTKLVAKITKGFIARNPSNSFRNERDFYWRKVVLPKLGAWIRTASISGNTGTDY